MSTNTPIPLLPTESAPGDLLRGLGLPLRAFALIAATPKLRNLSLACAVVTALSFVFVVAGSLRLADWGAGAIITDATGWWAAASVALEVILFFLLFAVGASTVPDLLLAPLQDPLSEATEERCGDYQSPAFSVGELVRGTTASLRQTLLRLTLMALGFVVLFPLNFVPVVGSVAWAVLSSVWSMFWLSVEQLSGPMARHGRPFRQVFGVLRKRLPLALGFGAALWLLLWVPGLNFFLMPVTVVAGTLLFRGLKQAGALG